MILKQSVNSNGNGRQSIQYQQHEQPPNTKMTTKEGWNGKNHINLSNTATFFCRFQVRTQILNVIFCDIFFVMFFKVRGGFSFC